MCDALCLKDLTRLLVEAVSKFCTNIIGTIFGNVDAKNIFQKRQWAGVGKI